MKKTLLILSILLISIINSNCLADQVLKSSGTTEIFLNDKVNAIGPHGNMLSMIASNEKNDSLLLTGYPHLTNIPDTLTSLKVYTYILNPMQFYYQNYRNGIYTRDYFLDYAKKSKWVLDDTLSLTSKMVKNYFTFAVGYDSGHNPKYVVDTNGNDDFSDDELFTLYSDTPASSMDNTARSVVVEYFDGVAIKQERINFLPKLFRSSESSIEVFFCFPQFRFARVSSEGTSYYICTEGYSRHTSLFIMPDQPNFTAANSGAEVKPDQLFKIGDLVFRYIGYSQNMDKVIIKREDTRSDDTNNKMIVAKTTIPVSERLGMMAPEIKGINILDGSTLSLNSLQGKYVFLDFWATFCGPCIKEFPTIRKAFDLYSSDQLVIFAVCEDNYRGKLTSFLKEKGVSWPTIVKSDLTTVTKGYNISTWPTNFLIGPDGIILETNIRGESLLSILEQLKLKKK